MRLLLTLGFGIAVLSQTVTAQDAANGEKLFKKCASCHQVGDGAKNRVGPVLTGVIGRPAGNVEGYKYGKSMKAAGAVGLIWQPDTLADYITNPDRFLKTYLEDPKAKAKMKFKLKNEADRLDVIAYLDTFSTTMADEPDADVTTQSLQALPTQLCVQNRAAHTHLFAVEATGTPRLTAMLDPGEHLCVDKAKQGSTGVVSVFEFEDELEGCSRLVPVGQTEGLLKYVDFDRCFWTSNS